MLTLTVTAVNGAPASTPMTATFGPQGGTIGRNPGVTLVLPDPERTISRQQALVRYEGGKYLFEDQGANATLVNGTALASGARCALKHGDMLKIGPYTLVAAITSAAGADATNIFRAPSPAAAAPAPAPQSIGPLADPMAGFPSAGAAPDPFAGLGGAPAQPAPTSPPAFPAAAAAGPDPFAELFGVPTSPQSSSPSAFAAAPGTIPDDFDPFGLAPPRSATAPAADFSIATPDQSQSIDQLFGLGGASTNPLDALGAPPAAAGPGLPASSTLDPLALFGGPASPAGAGPAQPNHTPEVHAAFTPPQAAPMARAPVSASERKAMDDVLASVPAARPSTVRPAAPPPPSAYTAPPPTAAAPNLPAGSSAALAAALAQGLRCRLDLPQGLNEEFMLRLGALVNEAVQGTIDLLAARAVSKREVKAEATMIMERNNNPMKFSSDASGALLFLLASRLDPAFMQPVAAMRDAYDDLRSHQFGVMAGMRAALEGVLDRFTPAELEKRLTNKGMLDTLIPAARKAKLWDLYTQMYQEIAREAGDDFHKLFGKAFLKAYEEQVAALRQAHSERR